MRKILFRGKMKDNNKWVYGDYLHTENRAYVQPPNSKGIVDGQFSMVMIEVIPETVGQYTGVKDKNGEKIFEGDLITFHTEYEMDNDDVWYEKEPYLVKWDNEIAGFEPFYLNGRWRCDIVNLKIVGNKWDNPELLEE